MEGWRRGTSWQIGMGATCFWTKKWEMYEMYQKKTHQKGDFVGEWAFFEDGVFNDVHVGITIKTNLSGLSIRYIRWWFSLTPDWLVLTWRMNFWKDLHFSPGTGSKTTSRNENRMSQRIYIWVSIEVIVTIVSKLDYFTYLEDVFTTYLCRGDLIHHWLSTRTSQ